MAATPDRQAPRWGVLGWGGLALGWVLAWMLVAALQPPPPVEAARPYGDRGRQEAGLWWPTERNAHRRLASVSTHLASIQVQPEGLRAWAVGEGGILVVTADGGRHWSAQATGVSAALSAVHFHADGRRGWAVGAAGTVIATEDGGRTWSRCASGTSAHLVSVRFDGEGLHGWAVGAAGTVIVTTDGGRGWRAARSATAADLASVHMLGDGRRGWAVGAAGTVIATEDGGRSWSVRRGGAREGLSAAAFHDDGLRGWAVGDDGSVLATADGGATWRPQPGGTRERLASLHFHADGRRGWAVGAGGTIIATADGGTTWTAQAASPSLALASVGFAADGRRGWAVGEGGTVIATADGGKTWVRQTRGRSADWASVHLCSDGLRGWAVGSGGLVVATADGGRTWGVQNSGTTADLWSVRFHADGLRGWAVGNAGTVIATADGGRTWRRQPAGTTQRLAALHVHDDGLRGWAVGANGTVIASADGGKSWDVQPVPVAADLEGVHFHRDGLRGWVVGAAGTVLATGDAGKTWRAQPSGLQAPLWSVHVHDDGRRGWAVGQGGAVIATADGGERWEVQTGRMPWGTAAKAAPVVLRAVAFERAGRRGWVVGWDDAGGLVAATTDGGMSWSRQAVGMPQRLHAAHWHDGGLRGWAVGRDGTVLATADGGKTWQDAWAGYRLYPALWFWLVLLPVPYFLWRAWQGRTAQGTLDSVADVGASDAAVQDFSDDRLEFAPLARGISRFLRNQETRPPLTLAITGDWGSGKSSLMRLSCADLRRYGYRPIWFNAWHHQKEEHLFAALLGAVREQVAPPAWRPAGLAFRLRLLWLRSRKHWVWAVLLSFAASALLTWLLTHPSNDWEKLWVQLRHETRTLDALARLFREGDYRNLDWPPLVARLGSGLAVFIGLRRGLTAIGADPATLLRGAAQHLRLKAATEHNTFRMRFATQFGEVTEALHGRMVLFIDDLDRCKPEAVLEVLEAVNFLTVAGECFVIFGMAAERVQAALGIAFERVARELAQEDLALRRAPGARRPDDDDEAAALQKRRDYARDYLQKLVNIEIKVPARADAEAYRLLVEPLPSVERQRLRRSLRALGAVAPGALLAGAALAGAAMGLWFEPEVPQGGVPALSASAPSRAAAAPAAASGASGPAGATPARPVRDDRSAGPVQFRPGEGSVAQWAWAALPLLGVGLALAVLSVQRLHQSVLEVRDSQNFRDALALWTQLVAQARNTPRAVKRFGNRIRYFAMLQQGAAENRSVGEQMAERALAFLARLHVVPAPGPRRRPPDNGVHVIGEAQLIALSALYELWGPDWRQAVYGDVDASSLSACARRLKEAHVARFGVRWPPAADDLETFDRLVAGVRLSGDAPVPAEPAGTPDAPGKPLDRPARRSAP